MTDARHSKQTISEGLHSIVAYEYADETARLAASGFDSADLYKVAIQLDTNDLYLLADISPITWVNFGNAGLEAQLNKVRITCRKSTSGTLPVGTVVYPVGYDTTNDRANVEAAKADSASTLPAVGIIDQQATDLVDGSLLIVGIIEGLNTNGTSAQTPIYVSHTVAGDWTGTPPPGPYVVQALGVVLKEDLSDGAIGVNVQGFRAIEYTSTPEDLGTSASAGTSNTSSASDHVHKSPIVDESNVYYVGKHGNDSNDGKTIGKAFLTFGAAITAAQGQTPGPTNGFNIVGLDSGIYSEDINCISYVNVTAPSAIISGEVTLADRMGFECLRVLVGAGETAFKKTAGTETSSVKALGISASGSGNGLLNDGTDSVIIAEIDAISVEDGDAVQDNSSGDGHIHIEAQDIYITGNGRGLVTAGGAGKIYADVDEIEDTGAGTTTGFAVLTGKIRARVTHIDCDTAYNVPSGATLEAFIGSFSGSTVETGTVNVTVAGADGDHGGLTGLADDDHTQYHNDTRGDVRYYRKTDWTNKTELDQVTDGDHDARTDNPHGVDAGQAGAAPSTHASQHQHLGADEIATATPSANAIPKADGSGKLNSWVDATGDLVGPASSTDEALMRFDGTTGKLAQNSGATLNDAGALTVPGAITSTSGGVTANTGTGSFGAVSAGSGGISTTGNITVDGTVDGRDVALDGTNQDSHIAAASPHSGHAVVSHASTHGPGGTAALKLDDLAAPDDNTDLDATVSAHGLLPKLGGGSVNFLRADGTWSQPPGAKEYLFQADMLEFPNSADWAVNSLATLDADGSNAGITVKEFDDTTEEGIGFTVLVPTGVTNIVFDFHGRALTAPGTVQAVALNLYERGIPDNAAVEAWSAATQLTNISIPTNAFYQYDTQTITLTTLGLTAGRLHQFELTRDAADAADTLVGDWLLHSLKVSFT